MAKTAFLSRAEAEAVAIVALQQPRRKLDPSPLRAAAADPLGFLADYGRVRTQRAIEPFQVLDWHRRVLAETTGRDVALKSRDVGSSTFWVALRLLDVLAEPPGDVLVAADRFDNAANLIAYARTLLTWLPAEWRPRLLKDNLAELAFESRDANGELQTSTIEAIPGTPESGRSYRCRHLICTEMGFWLRDEDYWNAVTGAVSADGTIVAESTWPKRGTNTVYGQLWDNPDKGFARHFVGRLDVPWHTAEWEARRRAEMTLGGFAREYPATPDEAMLAPVDAGLFRREWFAIVDEAPAVALRLRYWDFAATENSDSDWTSGALLALYDGVWTIADMRHLRGSPGAVEALVRQTAEIDGRSVPIRIEQEPGASGLNTIDHYQRSVLVGFNVRGDRATGNKIERMGPLAAAAQAGNVKLLRGAWNAAFLAEAEAVPNGEHDDQIDATAGAMACLSAGKKPFSWYGEIEARLQQ